MNIEHLRTVALKKSKNTALVSGFQDFIDETIEDLTFMELGAIAKGLEMACADVLSAKQFELVIKLALSEIENLQLFEERKT